MKITEFIQGQILLPRLQETGVIVVYDSGQRYRELCLELASDERQVVDASDSSIESRAAAMATLQLLGEKQPSIKELLIYVQRMPHWTTNSASATRSRSTRCFAWEHDGPPTLLTCRCPGDVRCPD